MSEFWRDQRVFLTGGTGFIGHALAERILAEGGNVTILTREAARAQDLAKKGCTIQEGNLLDPDTLTMEDPDTVIHAAAWVAYGIPKAKRDLFYETNVTGTQHVLEAAKTADADRFCHVSSVAAIGPTPAGLYTEERATNGRYPAYESLYAETKHKAHQHVLNHHGPLETTLPMPSVVAGLGSELEPLMRAYAKEPPFSLKGDTPTGFVHINDTVDGILAMIEHGQGPYILNDANLTVDELFALFEDASGIPKPTRRFPLGLLKLATRLYQAPYHVLGKVPPLSTEMLQSLETPKTYSAQRAANDLNWTPHLAHHLEHDFAHITDAA